MESRHLELARQKTYLSLIQIKVGIQRRELEEDWVPKDTTEAPYWPWALYLQIPLWRKKNFLVCLF